VQGQAGVCRRATRAHGQRADHEQAPRLKQIGQFAVRHVFYTGDDIHAENARDDGVKIHHSRSFHFHSGQQQPGCPLE